jgi:hypothetical protein
LKSGEEIPPLRFASVGMTKGEELATLLGKRIPSTPATYFIRISTTDGSQFNKNNYPQPNIAKTNIRIPTFLVSKSSLLPHLCITVRVKARTPIAKSD